MTDQTVTAGTIQQHPSPGGGDGGGGLGGGGEGGGGLGGGGEGGGGLGGGGPGKSYEYESMTKSSSSERENIQSPAEPSTIM